VGGDTRPHQGEPAEPGPPSGRQVETEGITIHRLTVGKTAEEWERYENLGVCNSPAPSPRWGKPEASAS
jgi:hypothetical protein